MLRRMDRVFALASLPLAASLLWLTGCAGSPDTVFANPSGGYFTYTVNVDEPTDIILYLTNTSGQPVHLVSISVPSPSKPMRLISTSVYDVRKIGYQPATDLGILPLECPRNYVPHPVSSLTVPAHAGSPWVASVAIRFDKPGVYWLHRFRIDYTTPQGSNWEYLIDPVKLTVREPARPGPKPEPPNQC